MGYGSHSFRPNLDLTYVEAHFGPVVAYLARGQKELNLLALTKSVAHKCPGCKSIATATGLSFNDSDWKEIVSFPELSSTCPHCKSSIDTSKRPMSEAAVEKHFAKRVETGCPRCDSKTFGFSDALWD